MIDGVNDSLELADELAGLVARVHRLREPDPLQPDPRHRLEADAAGAAGERSPPAGGARDLGVRARSRAVSDIAAACGQLKAEATQGRAPVQITPRSRAEERDAAH